MKPCPKCGSRSVIEVLGGKFGVCRECKYMEEMATWNKRYIEDRLTQALKMTNALLAEHVPWSVKRDEVQDQNEKEVV